MLLLLLNIAGRDKQSEYINQYKIIHCADATPVGNALLTSQNTTPRQAVTRKPDTTARILDTVIIIIYENSIE